MSKLSAKGRDQAAERELNKVLARLAAEIDKGLITRDGVRVMSELKKLGWLSKCYCYGITSEFSYSCGYKGAYNHSKLVKQFGDFSITKSKYWEVID